jgi:hypothetical protein
MLFFLALFQRKTRQVPGTPLAKLLVFVCLSMFYPGAATASINPHP